MSTQFKIGDLVTTSYPNELRGKRLVVREIVDLGAITPCGEAGKEFGAYVEGSRLPLHTRCLTKVDVPGSDKQVYYKYVVTPEPGAHYHHDMPAKLGIEISVEGGLTHTTYFEDGELSELLQLAARMRAPAPEPKP